MLSGVDASQRGNRLAEQCAGGAEQEHLESSTIRGTEDEASDSLGISVITIEAIRSRLLAARIRRFPSQG